MSKDRKLYIVEIENGTANYIELDKTKDYMIKYDSKFNKTTIGEIDKKIKKM